MKQSFLRMVHIDFRAQKLRPEVLPGIVRQLKELGYNALLVEYMDSFPYSGKLATLASPEAFTKEELTAFLEFCHEIEMEVVPLVQCFGHSYWVLRHPEFEHLAEGWHENLLDEERVDDWGCTKLHTMCPSNPQVREFWKESVKQICAMHPHSTRMHIGGDEIKMPSCPQCQKRLEKASLSDILGSHYLSCGLEVEKLGVSPMMWADIALAHPETIEMLKDHVTFMDWDYYSNGKPSTNGTVWGLQGLVHKPDQWPQIFQNYFRPYFYREEPDLINPFPYVKALQAAGCKVILACAARCSPDSFCIPMPERITNTEAAVQYAEDAGISGCAITSWSVRRSPWPLQLYPIISAALISQNRSITRDEIDMYYAQKMFGNPELLLGQLPVYLGNAVKNAVGICPVLASFNEYSDYKTGLFFGPPYGKTQFYTARIDYVRRAPERVEAAYAQLQEAVIETRKRLALAKPTTAEQKRNLSLWHWACDVLEFFCQVITVLTRDIREPETLLSWIEKAHIMEEKSRKALAVLYTPLSIEGGCQSRFGVLIDYLQSCMS